MKKLFIMLAVATASLAASAQNIFDSSDNRAFLGLRLSYELSCPTDVTIGGPLKADMFNNGSGFAVGAIYQIPVWKNLYVEPGATISYNTYAWNKAVVSEALEEEFGSNFVIDNASVRMWNVRVPILIGYNFDLLSDVRFSVFTGPEFQLGLSGDSHIKVGRKTITEGVYGDDGVMNRCDVKWRFGVGAQIFDHYYAAISGAAGICDLAKDAPKMRTNLFDITIGYNF